MSNTTQKPNFSASVLRGGTFIADAIFIALAASLVGYIGWHIADKPDWAAFLLVGGAIAALWSLWAFVLFGVASYFWGAVGFWRTLHPINIVLGLLFGAFYTVLVHQKIPQALTAFAIGSAAFMIFRRYLPMQPRAWLLLCLTALILRYAVPWRYTGVIAAAVAAFIGGAAWINWQASHAETHTLVEGVDRTDSADSIMMKPRTWLLLFLVAVILRYTIPWRYAGLTAAVVAALFIGVTAWINRRANDADKTRTLVDDVDRTDSTDKVDNTKTVDNTNIEKIDLRTDMP